MDDCGREDEVTMQVYTTYKLLCVIITNVEANATYKLICTLPGIQDNVTYKMPSVLYALCRLTPHTS